MMDTRMNPGDPFAEGADAALAGEPESANPYDPDEDCDAHLSWNDGWLSIQEADAEGDAP
jgi:hypothetical protein